MARPTTLQTPVRNLDGISPESTGGSPSDESSLDSLSVQVLACLSAWLVSPRGLLSLPGPRLTVFPGLQVDQKVSFRSRVTTTILGNVDDVR